MVLPARCRQHVQRGTPEFCLLARPRFIARAIRAQTRRDDPGFAETMVENHEAVVKTDVAVGQFKVVDRTARKLWLDEVFQIVTQVTKTATKREGKVDLVQQFEPGHQTVEQVPRIAKVSRL